MKNEDIVLENGFDFQALILAFAKGISQDQAKIELERCSMPGDVAHKQKVKLKGTRTQQIAGARKAAKLMTQWKDRLKPGTRQWKKLEAWAAEVQAVRRNN